MPQLTIELSAEELEVLHALAKRKRRSDAQQAAHTLVHALALRVKADEYRAVAETPEEKRRRSDATTAEALNVAAGLAEAQRRARAAGVLASEEQVGAVEGHRDGAAGGVDQVVVGGAGEA